MIGDERRAAGERAPEDVGKGAGRGELGGASPGSCVAEGEQVNRR